MALLDDGTFSASPILQITRVAGRDDRVRQAKKGQMFAEVVEKGSRWLKAAVAFMDKG